MSYLKFKRKPMPVLPELRPMYKIAKILIILDICGISSKSSLLKLHLFNWALCDEKRLKALKLSAENKNLIIGVWGIDPAINMALNFSISEKLINRTSNGMYQLTENGKQFIKKGDLYSLFSDDVDELKVIGKKITESMVNIAAKRWLHEV